MNQVTISERYWKKIKNDYSNWNFAIGRELGQNSCDAGSTEISIRITENTPTVQLSWKDNGCGMDEDVIVNKFLCFGETTKEGTNATGSFGIAKGIICFAHPRWEIKSQNVIVKGQYGEYKIRKSRKYRQGVETTVFIEGITANDLEENIRKWIRGTSTNTVFKLNGKRVNTSGLDNSTLVREYDWCKLYRHGTHTGEVHVRLNGHLMHSRKSGVNVAIVIDVNTMSSQMCLTSNRDALKNPYHDKLNILLNVLFTDPDEILKMEEAKIVFFKTDLPEEKANRKEENQVPDMEKIGGKAAHADKPRDRIGVSRSAFPETATPESVGGQRPVHLQPEYEERRWSQNFVMSNYTNQIPADHFWPETMDHQAWGLIAKWKFCVDRIMMIMYPQADERPGYVTGFAFDPEARACTEYRCETGHMIMICPAIIDVENRKMDEHWSPQDYWELVMLAAHECVHTKYGWHYDEWAFEYTQVCGRIAKELAEGKWKEQIYIPS